MLQVSFESPSRSGIWRGRIIADRKREIELSQKLFGTSHTADVEGPVAIAALNAAKGGGGEQSGRMGEKPMASGEERWTMQERIQRERVRRVENRDSIV